MRRLGLEVYDRMSFRATKLLLEQQETVRMTKDMGFFGTRVSEDGGVESV